MILISTVMLCVCLKVGIVVSCEDLFSDTHWSVCRAVATFVSQRTTGGKVVLDERVPL